MIEYLYSKEEAAELREAIIQNFVKPIVRKAFEKYTQLNSAMLLVAQYWDDEANDDVHHLLFFSVLETLDIEVALETAENDCIDPVNLPEILTHSNIQYLSTNEIESDRYENEKDYLAWKENHWYNYDNVVPAFAAFCKEYCHQNMRISEAYTPYAMLRRKGEEIEVEIVGKMLRPWLDGIKPEEWDE